MEAIEYVVGKSGEKKAVILSIDNYERLLEDLNDLSIIAERKQEDEITLEDLKKRLKRDGLLD